VTETPERYAVYFVPGPDTVLWRTGCRWLGRNPDTAVGGAAAPPPEAAVSGIPENDWAAATAEPRRYGFHATLKPPFPLAKGCDLADLDTALARFAAGRGRFHAPSLAVTRLDGFLALCPPAPDAALDALAADCLRAFEPFRRPLAPENLARRRARGLTPRQDALLETWGYPFVLAEFRFHMTLTGRLADDAAARYRPVLDRMFAEALAGPLAVDGIALFRESQPGAPFETVRRYSFAAR
jgi:putative phosphonate metabolism protein